MLLDEYTTSNGFPGNNDCLIYVLVPTSTLNILNDPAWQSDGIGLGRCIKTSDFAAAKLRVRLRPNHEDSANT
jgi:hypothetical protein